LESKSFRPLIADQRPESKTSKISNVSVAKSCARTAREGTQIYKNHIQELETQLRDEKLKRIKSENLLSEYLHKKKTRG
jgi:hypothetical protein